MHPVIDAIHGFRSMIHALHAGDLIVDLDGGGVTWEPVDDLLQEADLVGLVDDDVEIQPLQDQVGRLRVRIVTPGHLDRALMMDHHLLSKLHVALGRFEPGRGRQVEKSWRFPLKDPHSCSSPSIPAGRRTIRAKPRSTTVSDSVVA
jgi:hypothetical protein